MTTTARQQATTERTQSRRSQVLAAAKTCFLRSGFHAASMAEISKAAGMSPGHIYNCFGSKDAIIAAFVEQHVERVAALMRDFASKDDILQAIVDNVADGVRDHLNPANWPLQLEIAAEASRNPAIAAVVRDADLRARVQFRTLLVAGRERHQLAVDSDTMEGLVEALICLFQGVRLRAVQHPGLNQDSFIACCREMVRHLLFK
ncbi:MAG: TetR/AcrR family transcriptional regulator [Burkholderiaceae bacterium]|nr:TetR/AcrR family transcriptional regulator [Burkholderiaceae bacterium]